MPIAKSTNSDFVPVPEGTHVARCYAVISLGTRIQDQFRDAFKIMLLWEVPGETAEINGEPVPMVIHKEYTLSLGKKANLRRDLEGWRGRTFTEAELAGFEVNVVAGQPCLLSVAHKTSGTGNVYALVLNVSKLAKGMECPPQHHPNVLYEIEQGQDEVFKGLPEWIQEKIKACGEWTRPRPTVAPALATPGASNESEDDSIPF